ncbi:MAG TPA: PssD/Cps14F family polysaccharide biosynthesis glycosyltransferase [Clostridia bacterium]|nr:PssD/Cps14F family polysaccharide biosynthesis glycosyltransferase [Clostridia bacterium]
MNKKLCLICSVGGHLTQMQQLAELYKKYDYFFITERTALTADMRKKEKTYLMPMVNRKQWSFIPKLAFNLLYSAAILLKERPDIVISTGALNTVPFCLIAKLSGRKLVFIESYAKVNSPTVTGRLMYRIADLFIIQWQQLSRFYPKALLGGSIY